MNNEHQELVMSESTQTLSSQPSLGPNVNLNTSEYAEIEQTRGYFSATLCNKIYNLIESLSAKKDQTHNITPSRDITLNDMEVISESEGRSGMKPILERFDEVAMDEALAKQDMILETTKEAITYPSFEESVAYKRFQEIKSAIEEGIQKPMKTFDDEAMIIENSGTPLEAEKNMDNGMNIVETTMQLDLKLNTEERIEDEHGKTSVKQVSIIEEMNVIPEVLNLNGTQINTIIENQTVEAGNQKIEYYGTVSEFITEDPVIMQKEVDLKERTSTLASKGSNIPNKRPRSSIGSLRNSVGPNKASQLSLQNSKSKAMPTSARTSLGYKERMSMQNRGRSPMASGSQAKGSSRSMNIVKSEPRKPSDKYKFQSIECYLLLIVSIILKN